MGPAEILLIGHSHLTALGVPLQSENKKAALFKIGTRAEGFYGLTGVWPRNEAYWSKATACAENRNVVIVWQGNQHMTQFLFQAAPPFDFFCRRMPYVAVDSNAELVPEELIRACFQCSVDPLKPIISRLSAANAARVLVLATPPPKGDDRELRRFFHIEDPIREAIGRQGFSAKTVPLTLPAVRLKLWHTLMELTEETAVASGAQFVPLPCSLFDPSGFLKREYWAEDATHMNHPGGSRVLDHLAVVLYGHRQFDDQQADKQSGTKQREKLRQPVVRVIKFG
jgi:hypothetical protein